MTFEQAGIRFTQLQSQWGQGQIQPEQFQQMVAELQVQDPQGRVWQIEPFSAKWLVWNGSQWLTEQQLEAAAAPAVATPQPATVITPVRQARVAVWEGLATVAPGFVIEMLQRWPVYQKDMRLLAAFTIPALLPAILVPMARFIGRFVSILLVLGCLAWLSWPVISHASEMLGNPQNVQKQAGRGLVGVSLLYLIPRIWRAGK